MRAAASTGGGLSPRGGAMVARHAGVVESGQTRGPQKAVPERACGFESHLRHCPAALPCVRRASLERTMCGRYTLTNPDPARLRARFDLDESVELEHEVPRYNIAPTDPVLAIRRTRTGA